MKPKQTKQTCALSSTAPEARSFNLERQGPPERSQPKDRRPPARSRPPTAPKKKKQGRRKPSFFITLRLPKHTSTDQVTTSLRSSIAGSSSMLAVWGFESAPAHPRDPKCDSLLSGAGKTSLPLAAALREGSAPPLASLVANGCFLTLCVIRILEHKQALPLDRTQSSKFLEFLFKYEKYYSIAVLVKTGPQEVRCGQQFTF